MAAWPLGNLFLLKSKKLITKKQGTSGPYIAPYDKKDVIFGHRFGGLRQLISVGQQSLTKPNVALSNSRSIKDVDFANNNNRQGYYICNFERMISMAKTTISLPPKPKHSN